MTTREQRNEVRDTLRLSRNNRYPIKIIPGNVAPRLRGEGYYFTWTPNPNGTRVSHPNATKWPTYYHHSTMRIEVGEDWLNGCEIVIS